MSKALIIGAGGVAGVVIHKCCQNSEVFTEICIASRTKSKCDKFKEELQDKTSTKISTAQVDANNVDELVALINKEKPDIVINVALPYQDLTIMDACLATKTDYLDTANYEPEDTAKFEYKWQWDYKERFEKAGITAVLGCGFDPGVTGVFSAYAQKHYFDEINYIDILDCNGGDHGYPFATNFNPEINIREVSAKGSYIENGKWVETEPMEIKRVYNFDEVGEKDMYLLHHEELESLAINIKGIKRIRFFMTFGQSYLTHLKCLENVGMTSSLNRNISVVGLLLETMSCSVHNRIILCTVLRAVVIWVLSFSLSRLFKNMIRPTKREAMVKCMVMQPIFLIRWVSWMKT